MTRMLPKIVDLCLPTLCSGESNELIRQLVELQWTLLLNTSLVSAMLTAFYRLNQISEVDRIFAI